MASGSAPTVSLIINGQLRAASDSGTFSVYSPVTGLAIYEAASASAVDIEEALTTAQGAFNTWRDSTPLERRAIFLKAADIIKRRMSEFVDSMIKETGAKSSWASFNAKVGLESIQEAASMATQIKGEILQSNSSRMSVFAFREPVGTVLGIGTW